MEKIKAYILRLDEDDEHQHYRGYLGSIRNIPEGLADIVYGDIREVVIANNIVAFYSDINTFAPYNSVLIQDEMIVGYLGGNIVCVRKENEGYTSIQEEDIPIVKEHLIPFDLLIPVDGKFIPLLLKDEDMYDWTD